MYCSLFGLYRVKMGKQFWIRIVKYFQTNKAVKCTIPGFFLSQVYSSNLKVYAVPNNALKKKDQTFKHIHEYDKINAFIEILFIHFIRNTSIPLPMGDGSPQDS